MRIAVLGTGTMGAGMAHSLQRAGHDVVVWNRTKENAEKVGLPVADSVADAVTGADAVVTMLFDLDATLDIADELVGALGADAVWIQTATVGPDGARRLGELSDRMLDAPVLGTKEPAEQGKLVVSASGPKDLLDEAKPVFEAIGGRTVVAGDAIGQGSALKLAVNAWVALLTAGTAQSLALAGALGVEHALFLDAIAGGPTDSPYAQLKGKAMLEGTYEPSFAVDGIVKDLSLMVASVQGTDFPTGLLTAVRDAFVRSSDAGHGDDDIAAARYSFP